MRKKIAMKELCPFFFLHYREPYFKKFFLLLFSLIVFSSQFLFAQNKTVSGIVRNENGVGLPGVSVAVKGSTGGVTTNADGAYTIPVFSNAPTLVFSYVNYVTQEFTVTNSAVLNVSMVRESNRLNEVVVIGYILPKCCCNCNESKFIALVE